jgi:hypothetical protein
VLDPKYRKEIEDLMDKYADAPEGVLERELQKHADKRNNTGRPEFDGLSPNQMYDLLYFDCDDNMIRIKDESGDKCPLIKEVKYLLNIIKDNQEIRLTKTGSLPPVIVKDIYAQGILKDIVLEFGIGKLTKEKDSETIGLVKVLCEIAGLVKKRKNVLTLTKKGIDLLDKNRLFKCIFIAFCSKLNWSYFEQYVENQEIGQFGCHYSIYLLNKYGSEKRPTTFYANKYFEAWFKEYAGKNTDYSWCYSRRTFDRFLDYFGFLEDFEENKIGIQYVKKSSLFDEYITIANENARRIIGPLEKDTNLNP